MFAAARYCTAVLLVCAFSATATAADKQIKIYRWVDDQGVVHVGDQVPPEFAGKERHVLNAHGIPVVTQPGSLTAEQVTAQKAAAAKAEEDRKKAAAASTRDRVLLDTYLSVEEIESLRDRRLELMASQIKVTDAYLGYLKAKQQKLKTEAADFRPYNTNPKAPAIDDKLAAELADTMNSIQLYEKNLVDAKTKQAALVSQFATDIQRFRELKAAQAAN